MKFPLACTGQLPGLLLILMSWPVLLQSQAVNQIPCKTDAKHLGWKVYVNRELRFCLLYPPIYHEVPAPPPRLGAYLASLDLNKLPPGTSGTPAKNKAGISFTFIPKHFSIGELQRCCASTGADEAPPPHRFNRRIFYFYGAGGGGTVYPDQFLTEINGKILDISFYGPWKDSKSPIEETTRLEPKILSTFRTY